MGGIRGAVELVRAAQEDDRRALVALMRDTQHDVWRLCAHIAGRDHADDVAQEVYLRAWRALGRSTTAKADLRAWLLGIARHVAIDEVRSLSRRRRLVARLGAVEPERDDVGERLMVDDLLGALGVERRTAFVLTQVLGLSYDEAAKICGCAVGTIRSRVYRARADLADAVMPAPASDMVGGPARPLVATD